MKLLFNKTFWVQEATPEILKSQFKELLITCDFEVLNFMEHHFSPQGYTCIWLLGESHLAIHTYPEFDRSYIELTSCAEAKNDLFEKLIRKQFKILSFHQVSLDS